MRQSRVALPYFGFWPRSRSLCRLLPALLLPGFSRRYFCESFPRCPSPCPGGLLSAFAWFFPSIHRPSPSFDWVGFPLPSVNTTFHGSAFEAAAISLCSGLRVCSPPRSFLPLQVSPQGSRGFLHPSRTCVVTFARIGHAIRPTTGNWRSENFHLARFAALSAATEWCRLAFPRTDGHECSTAPHGDVEIRRLRVTHPYHPLFQQEFELVSYCRNWGEDRVWFQDKLGRLQSLPTSWTDAGAVDPFVALAAGRSLFRVADLIELARLISQYISSIPHRLHLSPSPNL
jgi:hypothetical protein